MPDRQSESERTFFRAIRDEWNNSIAWRIPLVENGDDKTLYVTATEYYELNSCPRRNRKRSAQMITRRRCQSGFERKRQLTGQIQKRTSFASPTSISVHIWNAYKCLYICHIFAMNSRYKNTLSSWKCNVSDCAYIQFRSAWSTHNVSPCTTIRTDRINICHNYNVSGWYWYTHFGEK